MQNTERVHRMIIRRMDTLEEARLAWQRAQADLQTGLRLGFASRATICDHRRTGNERPVFLPAGHPLAGQAAGSQRLVDITAR